MKLLWIATVSMLFAGCTFSESGFNCDETAANVAFNIAQDYEFGDDSLVLRIEGTMEGEIDSMVLYLDKEGKGLRLKSNVEGDIRIKDGVYSFDTLEEGYAYRDYAGLGYDQFLEFINEEEPSFADDLGFDDYELKCEPLGTQDVFTFSFDNGEQVDQLTVEATHPFRPLSGRVVDPALQDNFRVSVSYERPTINVNTDLPRLPTDMYLTDVQAVENERGGITMEAEFADETEWSKFSEIEFHLVDDAGTVYRYDSLDDGAWDLDDGDYFEFDDRDNNDMVSAGDQFYMDLGPGLDIMFYDEWAQEYANINA